MCRPITNHFIQKRFIQMFDPAVDDCKSIILSLNVLISFRLVLAAGNMVEGDLQSKEPVTITYDDNSHGTQNSQSSESSP